MPARNADLHGNAPDQAPVALLLLDVINDLEFPGGELLLPHALQMATRLAALKARARRAGVPAIYVNDNFGRWRSDRERLLGHCLAPGRRGAPLVEALRPQEDDYFVLKPKHSGFYATSLELLLRYLQTRTLILTGIAGNLCVHFTANDAFLRDYRICVPADCTASNDPADNQRALDTMRSTLKADVTESPELDLDRLLRQSWSAEP